MIEQGNVEAQHTQPDINIETAMQLGRIAEQLQQRSQIEGGDLGKGMFEARRSMSREPDIEADIVGPYPAVRSDYEQVNRLKLTKIGDPNDEQGRTVTTEVSKLRRTGDTRIDNPVIQIERTKNDLRGRVERVRIASDPKTGKVIGVKGDQNLKPGEKMLMTEKEVRSEAARAIWDAKHKQDIARRRVRRMAA